LILLIILFIFLIPSVLAWDDCPFGFVDEEYPGYCGRYIDTNNDGICDHSQSEPVQLIVDNEQVNQTISNKESTKNLFENKNFLILLISFLIIIFTIITLRFLVKKEIISKLKEKIIWNILLLIFFLPSAITAFLLVLMINFQFLRDISLNFIEFHSITSFFFMWISAYHIIWHTNYYLKSVETILSSK